MNARAVDDFVAYGAVRRALYASSPAELETTLVTAADRVPAMVAQLRIGEPGASDRAEQLASQLDGIRQQALRLGAALRDVALTQRGA